VKQSQPTRRSSLLVAGALVLVVLLFGGLMLVAAQETDGRVNPADHVGGAAVYCVDASFTPAENWSDGGIRVLDAEGQELLFAPAADIITDGDPPTETILVGSGANAYGALALYYRPDSKFQLLGIDEHGKAFEFIWGGCGYQTTAPASTAAPTATCEPARRQTGALAPGAIAPTIDPCLVG
jgi:hypothetical protein